MAIQNHIHMDLTTGSAPENAPDTKWVVTEWALSPRVTLGLKYGLTGKLKKHRLVHDGGDLIQYRDYRYMVKVSDYDGLDTDTRKQLLLDMNGQDVLFCDVFHPENGVDHTPDVRQAVLRIEQLEKFDQALQRFYVAIELVDDTV
jgi:hypothetical protein